jgi:hypothetical protein
MSSIFGNVVDGLKKLMQALQAIEPAPDDHTVYFNDTVLVSDPNAPAISATLSPDTLVLDNGGDILALDSNQIQSNGPIVINGTTGGSGAVILEDQSNTVAAFESAGIYFYQNVQMNSHDMANANNISANNLEIFTGGNITFDSGGAGPYPSISNNGITYDSNNPWGGSTLYNDGGISISDNTGDYQSGLALNGAFIIHNATGQATYFQDYKLLSQNTVTQFTFEDTNNFFRWNAGFSYNLNVNDTHIEIFHSFKVSDGPPMTFNSYSDYLDSFGNAGWSVILSNSSGSDIDIISNDLDFYSHGTMVQSSPFPLRKYATARFTLVPAASFVNGYAWAVSMY